MYKDKKCVVVPYDLGKDDSGDIRRNIIREVHNLPFLALIWATSTSYIKGGTSALSSNASQVSMLFSFGRCNWTGPW